MHSHTLKHSLALSSDCSFCFPCCALSCNFKQQNAVPDPPVKSMPGSSDYSYLTDLYNGEFPKVLIQLPMYNEDAHCDLIIQRCCKIKWPSHRILIQVGLLAECRAQATTIRAALAGTA